MENFSAGIPLLAWIASTAIAVWSLARQWRKDNKDNKLSITNSNITHALEISDRFEKSADKLRVRIEEMKTARSKLIIEHEQAMLSMRKEFVKTTEEAKTTYAEIGKMKIEFEHLQVLFGQLTADCWRLHDQLEENGIRPVVVPTVTRLNGSNK